MGRANSLLHHLRTNERKAGELPARPLFSSKPATFSLASRGLPYPDVDEILSKLYEVTQTIYTVDGPQVVREVGVSRTLNVVMLGALAGLKMLPFGDDVLWEAVEQKIPPHFLEANRKAFLLGRDERLIPWIGSKPEKTQDAPSQPTTI